uniref:Immunity related GTPase Q n=1 Tax=Pan troglodytes TaxID=9598 RepID=K7CZE8_PANTR
MFSSAWLLSPVSVGGWAVALAAASSAAGVVAAAAVTAAGTSACLGSSLAGASSALEDGELSVEALVALSVSAEPAFSSEDAGAWGAACSVAASPSPFFSSEGVSPALPGSSGLEPVAGAASAVVVPSPFFSTPSATGASSFLLASASAAWTSSFFSPLSFFLVMCPRKLA